MMDIGILMIPMRIMLCSVVVGTTGTFAARSMSTSPSLLLVRGPVSVPQLLVNHSPCSVAEREGEVNYHGT